MPSFAYHAMDPDGAHQDGRLVAETRDQAHLALQARGYRILRIEPVSAEPPTARAPQAYDDDRPYRTPVGAPPLAKAPPPREAAAVPPPLRAELAPRDGELRMPLRSLCMLTLQFDVMLAAGFSYVRCLKSLSESDDLQVAQVASVLLSTVKAGLPVSTAMARMPGVFSAFYVQMIKVGETTGNVPIVLRRLTNLTRLQEQRRTRIIAALTYPAFLGLACAGMLAFLVYWMLPGYVSVFAQSGAHLPALTQILITVSRSPLPGLALGGLVGGPALLWAAARANANFRDRLEGLKYELPGLREWFRDDLISTVCRSLGGLMESGVSVLEALNALYSRSSGNRRMDEALRRVAESIRGGATLSGGFAATGLFPRFLQAAVATGEQSGRVPDMLMRAAQMLEERQEHRLDSAIRVLEPTMLLGMGIVVAFVVLAAFLPVFELVKAL